MASRIPVETITPPEADRIRTTIAVRGEREAARVLGLDPRTMIRALALLTVHRLTVATVRARLSQI
jgi:hypothetical protein